MQTSQLYLHTLDFEYNYIRIKQKSINKIVLQILYCQINFIKIKIVNQQMARRQENKYVIDQQQNMTLIYEYIEDDQEEKVKELIIKLFVDQQDGTKKFYKKILRRQSVEGEANVIFTQDASEVMCGLTTRDFTVSRPIISRPSSLPDNTSHDNQERIILYTQPLIQVDNQEKWFRINYLLQQKDISEREQNILQIRKLLNKKLALQSQLHDYGIKMDRERDKLNQQIKAKDVNLNKLGREYCFLKEKIEKQEQLIQEISTARQKAERMCKLYYNQFEQIVKNRLTDKVKEYLDDLYKNDPESYISMLKEKIEKNNHYKSRKMSEHQFLERQDSPDERILRLRQRQAQPQYNQHHLKFSNNVQLIPTCSAKFAKTEGSLIKFDGNQNQCIFIENSLPTSGRYQFTVQILTTKKCNIMVGIGRKDDVSDYKKQTTKFPLFYGRNRLVWGQNIKLGKGFKQGDTVSTTLTLETRMLSWSVNDQFVGEVFFENFIEEEVQHFAPCILFENKGDCVKWLGSKILQYQDDL